MNPEALARLHAAAGLPERPWSAAEFAALLAAPGMLLLGDDRAFLLARIAADEAELLMLVTHPAHRRQGLARGLIRAFLREAAARGAARAFLEVAEDNAAARALYAAEGWTLAGRRPGYYRRPGLPAAAAILLRHELI
ncbi:Acetyltransferase [Rubellimicrobium thermophilum DSM 16684]|uniref:Acetyltransferase n=1 Tax=Rubellimicrobium thermophilum DSM 16684 TaxID=1123069 RepID=S9QTN7_9RHOB|nr:GNAT family N-acetyltransferase [Rubellimicrobium thermophilum]EPX84721.1 Acetyltransferase [Rubellimicrobium thermophilum DSM 16684]